jgi:hypothetical protein
MSSTASKDYAKRHWAENKERIKESRKLRSDSAREYGKKYYANNKEKIKPNAKASLLRRHYGLTEEEKRKVLEFQRGLCGICKKPLDKPNTDHDHKTGETRGLLCFRCNYSLGSFRDDLEQLEAALAYMRQSVVELALGSKRYGLPGRTTTTIKRRRMLAKKSGVPLECYRFCCPELLKEASHEEGTIVPIPAVRRVRKRKA